MVYHGRRWSKSSSSISSVRIKTRQQGRVSRRRVLQCHRRRLELLQPQQRQTSPLVQQVAVVVLAAAAVLEASQ